MSATLSEFIENLFASFRSKGIEFVILRNYESLPFSLNSKDLDILIEHRNLKNSIVLLHETAKKLGYYYYSEIFYKNIYCYTFFDLAFNSIKVDLLVNYENKGRIFLTSEEILNKAEEFSSFKIPAEEHEFTILLFKTLLAGGFVNEKYFPKIKKLAIENSRVIGRILKRYLSKKTADEILRKILTDDIEGINKMHKIINLQTYLKLFFNSPISFLVNFLMHYYIEFLKLLNPSYKRIIVVLGPDGVGKTTFIENLVPKLAKVLKIDSKGIKVYHFRPNVFPNLGKLFGKETQNFTVYKPYSEKPANFLSSFLRLTYYTLDYILGYLISILPKQRKGNIFIFDRYYHEFLVDSERSKIRLPLFMRKIFFKIVPKSTLTIVLLAPEKVILERKSELDEEKIRQLIESYKSLKNLDKNVYFLDATKQPSDLTNEALKIIIEHFANPI
jgi:thymidylate kinase